jgi:hypothetical protein
MSSGGSKGYSHLSNNFQGLGEGGGHPQVHHPLGISDSVVDDKLTYLFFL